MKIREGRPAGVATHTKRARELLGVGEAASVGESGEAGVGTLGLDFASMSAVLTELERYRPECWHPSRCPVVKALSVGLRGRGRVSRSSAVVRRVLAGGGAGAVGWAMSFRWSSRGVVATSDSSRSSPSQT